MKDDDFTTRLGTPNDSSHGQCYAPVENGHIEESKKKHFKAGEDSPEGWVEIECSSACP